MDGIFLGLGTNLGNRQQNLDQAIAHIADKAGAVIRRSSVHETKAWGITDQPDFLNMAICIETSLSPMELLHVCQQIEEEMGRIRHEKWGPRLIDIDLLYYHDEVINTPELTLPHPFIEERDFVLNPLKEIL